MNKVFCLLILTTNLSFAEIKFSAPILLARSNARDSFNLPPLTYLANVAPVINNKSEVAFKVLATGEEGLSGIWVKAVEDTIGKVQYLAPPDRLVTDPTLNDHGIVAFSLFDDSKSDGLFTLDIHKLTNKQVLNSDDLDLTFYTYPTIINKDQIFFRGTNKNNDRAIYLFDSKLTKLIEEGVEINDQIGSYIFRPSLNNDGFMAFKMRLGSKGAWDETNPDVIAEYNLNATDTGTDLKLKNIVADRDADKTSHYIAFLNSPSISNARHIGFSAVTDDGRIGVFIHYPFGETKRIALENEGDIQNVETFSVKVNIQGHVLFRGKDKLGKRAIFFYDGDKVTKLIKEGDEIESDLGTAKILDNLHFPGISGEVDINDLDQIVFGVVIKNAKEGNEWGNGIYQMNPIN